MMLFMSPPTDRPRTRKGATRPSPPSRTGLLGHRSALSWCQPGWLFLRSQLHIKILCMLYCYCSGPQINTESPDVCEDVYKPNGPGPGNSPQTDGQLKSKYQRFSMIMDFWGNSYVYTFSHFLLRLISPISRVWCSNWEIGIAGRLRDEISRQRWPAVIR